MQEQSLTQQEIIAAYRHLIIKLINEIKNEKTLDRIMKEGVTQKLKEILSDITPEELAFMEKFVEAVVVKDEERQYQLWRDVLITLDEIPAEIKGNPFVQRYLKERAS